MRNGPGDSPKEIDVLLSADPRPERAWAKYFAALYPKGEDFMPLRSQLDPHDVLVTGYWREHLGLDTVGSQPEASS